MSDGTVNPRRLIEVDLPIRQISAHARRERYIRSGHISDLHIWWARRPLAACRAITCAALWPDPADSRCPSLFRDKARSLIHHWTQDHLSIVGPESFRRFSAIQKNPAKLENDKELRNALLDFIADFADWDNSTSPHYLRISEALTESAHEALTPLAGAKPLVFDPFAGGGAMPLEASRVGAEAFAVDLNPVAALLNAVILEYVPRFGERIINEVERWGTRYRNIVNQRLRATYPKDPNGSEPIAYFWARTIVCEGPNCGVTVPIIKSYQFAKRKGSEAGVRVTYQSRELVTTVVTGPEASELTGGTSRRSSVTCPRCGYTTKRARVEAQANQQGFGYWLFAVCVRPPHQKGRLYRQPTEQDVAAIDKAQEQASRWETENLGGLSAIPREELPYLRSIFNVRVYGVDQWAKLFTPRQLHSALTHAATLRELADTIKADVPDRALADAVINCLALAVSNGLQYQCNIATYLSDGIVSAFIQGQSLGMKMDFVEANPVMSDLVGGLDYTLHKHLLGLRYLTRFSYSEGTARQASATTAVLPENSCSLVATDPPYYDVVPYADCADFFYVWLRRMLHGITQFPTQYELSPKDEEVVQLAERNPKYRKRTKAWFEEQMRVALERARAALTPSGCAVIVFAHKDTRAWEVLLQSVLNAGWTVTGSWPIDTEKTTRLRANASAVLGSSIHLVCRPRENSDGSLREHYVGDWRDVLQELPVRIREWMQRLAEEGVVGADAIFACLGPALEIFSRYSHVEKVSGEYVALSEYLEQVWATVAKEALVLILKDTDISGFEPDARLTAMWLWTLSSVSNSDGKTIAEEVWEASTSNNAPSGYGLEYDAGRKIAQALGVRLETLGSVVEVDGDDARLLTVAMRAKYLLSKDDDVIKQGNNQTQLRMFTAIEEAEEQGVVGATKTPKMGSTVLDRIHQSMILFAAGRSEALRRFLVEDGVGQDQRFWKLAQALSALYPPVSDEKRWVDGVLARKKGFGF